MSKEDQFRFVSLLALELENGDIALLIKGDLARATKASTVKATPALVSAEFDIEQVVVRWDPDQEEFTEDAFED